MLTINPIPTDHQEILRNPVPFPSPRRRFRDLTGETYEWLTVVAYAGVIRLKDGVAGESYWLCQCACGGFKFLSLSHWGVVKSCGCYYHGLDPDNPSIKQCAKCHAKLPYTKEFFHADKQFKHTGLDSRCKECQRKVIKKRGKQDRAKWRRLVLMHYGKGDPKCECCPERHEEFLTIDHINGGGRQHRKLVRGNFYYYLVKNNFPEGYRLLCGNCNLSLGVRGYCPHQTERQFQPEYVI